MLPPWPEAEILEEVVVTPRRAAVPLPDLRRIERPGWTQLITPSLRTGGLNEVAFAALADGDADAVIDATIAEYRALGIAFRWVVPPGSAPPDLGARLRARGATESWTRGMARATAMSVEGRGAEGARADAGAAAGAGEPAIRVEEIADDAGLDVFTRVMAEGWQTEAGALRRVNAHALGAPERRHRLFLARWDGEPVGVATYVAFPRSAYLLGAVVLPPFRGRGLYRALARARLEHARARGIELATSHAREATSAPILERLGFVTLCRFPIYFFPPPT